MGSCGSAAPLPDPERFPGGRTSSRHTGPRGGPTARFLARRSLRDRKSTRLNSSHGYISYAVFCLKKKKKKTTVKLTAYSETQLADRRTNVTPPEPATP